MRLTLRRGVSGRRATASPQVKWAVPPVGFCAVSAVQPPGSASARHPRATRWVWTELEEERWAEPGVPETERHRTVTARVAALEWLSCAHCTLRCPSVSPERQGLSCVWALL